MMRSTSFCWLLLLLAACGGASSQETAPAETTAACLPTDADGIPVAETDAYGGAPYALGYPPYALDACILAYVARSDDGSPGDLVVRDLGSGAEVVVEPREAHPRRPALAGSTLAWEAELDGRRVVRLERAVVVDSGVSPITLTGPFDHAGEPRAIDGAVVFTGWLTADEAGDTDVFLYSGGGLVAIATGPGQQRFADVSERIVAVTDFSEDPDGTFDDNETDVADVTLVDRATGKATPIRLEGKQAFPLLTEGDGLAMLGWGAVHPEPKFGEFDLLVASLGASGPSEPALLRHITTRAPYIRPTTHGVVVDWVEWPLDAAASLWREPADGSAPATLVEGLEGSELFGPVASGNMTVLASRTAGGAMTLRAAAR
jgi:hypothetical protein